METDKLPPNILYGYLQKGAIKIRTFWMMKYVHLVMNPNQKHNTLTDGNTLSTKGRIC